MLKVQVKEDSDVLTTKGCARVNTVDTKPQRNVLDMSSAPGDTPSLVNIKPSRWLFHRLYEAT
jgi:hypothetical protein